VKDDRGGRRKIERVDKKTEEEEEDG
jgi:hypothetical protein